MSEANQQQASTIHKDVFSVIFNASVEGIIAVDTSGKILIANPSCCQLFNYSRAELHGMLVEELIPQQFKKNHVKLRTDYVKNPEPRKMGRGRDLMGLQKDGSIFPIEVSLTHTHYEDRQLIIAFIIDITERKKSDEALKKSELQLLKYASELEEKVQERTKKLAESAKDLEKSNALLKEEVLIRKKAENEAKKALEKERELSELKSRFVSMASHEFRTPLSTILSSAALISKYIDEEAQEKRLKHVDRIKSNVEDLTEVLNDFLSLAKLEDGKINNKPVQFAVNQFVADLIEEMKLSLKKDQKIIFKPIAYVQEAYLDKTHLKSIITNLTSNAIKYSEEGKDINIILSSDKDSLTVSIKDNGIGIPVNDQAHLFERFFRAKNAINIQGTGLGLNLIKKYIELVNGTISFTSEEGIGTTFMVKLPINLK